MMLSVITIIFSFSPVFATTTGVNDLTNFISIQSKRFGIDSTVCINQLATCDVSSKGGRVSTGGQVAIAVVILAVLIALLKFVKFVMRIVIGHALALGMLYTLGRYVPFMRRYFIQVLSNKIAM
jgi:hypothetical protein